MRENRTYGSEGGEPSNGSLPYPYQGQGTALLHCLGLRVELTGLSAYNCAKLLAENPASLAALGFPKDYVKPAGNQGTVLFSAIPIEHAKFTAKAVIGQGAQFTAL